MGPDPTYHPTMVPTNEPTQEPTAAPTYEPTTHEPTSQPTAEPTSQPTAMPTSRPTRAPTSPPGEPLVEIPFNDYSSFENGHPTVLEILKTTQGISESELFEILSADQVEIVDADGEILSLAGFSGNESQNWSYPVTLRMWFANWTVEPSSALNNAVSFRNICLLCMAIARLM